MEPQYRQPGTPDWAAHLGFPYLGVTQRSLALQAGALLPLQRATRPLPRLPGRAVGESQLACHLPPA